MNFTTHDGIRQDLIASGLKEISGASLTIIFNEVNNQRLQKFQSIFCVYFVPDNMPTQDSIFLLTCRPQ
jgi:hypothetical protein